DILEFTNVVGQLSLATDVVDEQGAFFLARFDSLTGQIGNFDAVASALVNLGNNFAATESQIVDITERIVGAGNAAGFTQPEILAWATAIRAVGIEAESGGSSFSTFMSEFTSSLYAGGERAEAFAGIVGKTLPQMLGDFQES